MKKKTSRGAAAAGSRPARVGELVRQELSSMFQDGWVRDPRFSRAFVTVTGVTMSQDLSFGTAHISVYSEDRAVIDGVMDALRESARELRRELGQRLTIRHTPDLRFSHDGSAAYGEKMERLLKDIRSSDTVREPIPVEDTDPGERTDPDIGAASAGDDFAERTNPDVLQAIEDGEDTPAELGVAPSTEPGLPAHAPRPTEPASPTPRPTEPATPPTEVPSIPSEVPGAPDRTGEGGTPPRSPDEQPEPLREAPDRDAPSEMPAPRAPTPSEAPGTAPGTAPGPTVPTPHDPSSTPRSPSEQPPLRDPAPASPPPEMPVRAPAEVPGPPSAPDRGFEPPRGRS